MKLRRTNLEPNESYIRVQLNKPISGFGCLVNQPTEVQQLTIADTSFFNIFNAIVNSSIDNSK